MKLVVATGNAHKLIEFKRILEPMGYDVVGQNEICPEIDVEETGVTFAENAYLKAIAIHRITGVPVVADDSGLCVDALNGEPGVYSARYAGENATDTDRNIKLLKNMEQVPVEHRGGQFVSSICCVYGEDDIITCEGICKGNIGYAPCGENGFGYDPLFMIGDRSFAQLSGAEKDLISHRGLALEMLRKEIERRKTTRGEINC